MNNSFRIIIVNININKTNTIDIYINNTQIITKNVTLSESALTKAISSLENITYLVFQTCYS